MPCQTPVGERFSRREAARGRKTGKRNGKSCWRTSRTTIRSRYTREHLRNSPGSYEVSIRSSFEKKSTSFSESRSSRCAATRSWNLLEQWHCFIPKSQDTVNIFSFKYFTLHLYFVMPYFFLHFLCMYFCVHIHKRKCIFPKQNKLLLLLLLAYARLNVGLIELIENAKRKIALKHYNYNCSVTIWSSLMRFIIAKQTKLLAIARIITRV